VTPDSGERAAMNDEMRTALVVLATPPGVQPGGGGFTVADGPPVLPANSERVRNWFAENGFEADPVVGIAFSISGPARLFSSVLGLTDPAAVAELDRAALTAVLPADLLDDVVAVVIGPPPAFGPLDP
jgi:hypothetical protein